MWLDLQEVKPAISYQLPPLTDGREFCELICSSGSALYFLASVAMNDLLRMLIIINCFGKANNRFVFICCSQQQLH